MSRGSMSQSTIDWTTLEMDKYSPRNNLATDTAYRMGSKIALCMLEHVCVCSGMFICFWCLCVCVCVGVPVPNRDDGKVSRTLLTICCKSAL